MFDEKMRSLKDTAINPLAGLFLAIPPWGLSVVGLLMGVFTAVFLYQQQYLLGLLFWGLNRLFDGLDGAVARLSGRTSDFGGYLDIIFDFIVYAIIPIALVLGRGGGDGDTLILALIFLLSTYYVNGASWMYLAAILEKRNQGNADRLTSITMPAGLVGGTESIIFYTAFILLPAYLVWLFGVMGLLIVITIGQRLVWAARHLD